MYFKVVLTAAAMLVSAPAFAQFYATNNDSIHTDAVPGEYFFGLGVNAINHNDYKHAVAMYKIAASWGYKPAEYNLGVIFSKGEGDVPVDLPQAYAWMQLAAERNEVSYVAARNRVKDMLTAEQLQTSEKILPGLSAIYGDAVALPRAKAKWRDVLTHATCSHVGFTGCNMKAGNGNNFRSNPSQLGKPTKSSGSPNVNGMDIVGGNAVDGSLAYSDLRATDNPYDPRFNGVVTVGAVKPANGTPKDKPAPDSKPSN
jgi:TPR repeat protein